MLHQGAEHLGAERLPIGEVRLGDGHEITAQEHAGDAGQLEQGLGQGRTVGGAGGREIGGAGAHHVPARQELKCRRVRGALGLDEHLGGILRMRTAKVLDMTKMAH